MKITHKGLVLASINELLELRLEHLMSAVDHDPADFPVEHRCGTHTTVTGYTEWLCRAEFPITIGWDWAVFVREGIVHLQREEIPRTNILLLNKDGHALDCEKSLCLLATWVDAQPWQMHVAMAVSMY
jgi:Domain of unknown function (DUF4902)